MVKIKIIVTQCQHQSPFFCDQVLESKCDAVQCSEYANLNFKPHLLKQFKRQCLASQPFLKHRGCHMSSGCIV